MHYDTRVGYDLFDATGRWNFRICLKLNRGDWPWWKLVVADTLGHVSRAGGEPPRG